MRIGFDIGGTKIAAVAIDEAGQTLIIGRWPLPDSYAALLGRCMTSIQEFEAATGRAAERVGIGIAGPINEDGVSAHTAHIGMLCDQPIGRDLAAALKRPVTLANDANCFALSEARDGAGVGQRMVLGAILGTGIGGGIVLNGEIWNGRQSLAGEWGHIPMPWRQPGDGEILRCPCGRMGCVQTLLSGAALRRLFIEISGMDVDGPTLSLLVEQEEPEALALMNVFSDRLARVLMMVMFTIDPDIIVLGGSVSQLPGLIPRVKDIWAAYNFAQKTPLTELALAKHGPDSGMRGAAWL